MSKQSSFFAAVKFVTLSPLIVIVYYSDFSQWQHTIMGFPGVAFLLVASGISIVSIWYRRRIIDAYIEIPKRTFYPGLVLLILAALAYLVGSFSSNTYTYLFHYESLILLIMGYSALRFDGKFLRVLLPVFGAFAVAAFPQFLGQFLVAIFISFVDLWLMWMCFQENPRFLVLPGLMVFLGAIAYLSPTLSPLGIAIPFLSLALVSRGFRRSVTMSNQLIEPLEHKPSHGSGNDRGFCLVCGRKFNTSGSVGKFGLSGLVIVIIAILILPNLSLPFIVLNGSNAPSRAEYSFAGAKNENLVATPPGWLINSSNLLPTSKDSYAERIVFVPSYHPETANYTLYYELAQTSSFDIAGSLGNIAGWNGTSQPYNFGPFSGNLIAYTSSTQTMMVFSGSTSFVFQNGGSFEAFDVALSITRIFTGLNSSEGRSQFTLGLNNLFLSTVQSQSEGNVWTSFYSYLVSVNAFLENFYTAVIVAVLIIWITYRLKLREGNLDGFANRALGLSDTQWSVLSRVLTLHSHGNTASEIADSAGIAPRQTVEYMKDFENKGFVKRIFAEHGMDVFLEWRLSL